MELQSAFDHQVAGVDQVLFVDRYGIVHEEQVVYSHLHQLFDFINNAFRRATGELCLANIAEGASGRASFGRTDDSIETVSGGTKNGIFMGLGKFFL